jgi:hypothetical protein
MELTENAVTFFIAGYDTTANTLAFACYCLGTNPDVQEKLVDEIDTVLQGVCIYREYTYIVGKYNIYYEQNTVYAAKNKPDTRDCLLNGCK